jgi:cullin 1
MFCQGAEVLAARRARIAADRRKDRDDREYVDQLVALHEKFVTLLHQRLEGHTAFVRRLQAAFATVVNTPAGRHHNAELLSTASHHLLRRGGEEEEVRIRRASLLDDLVRVNDGCASLRCGWLIMPSK